MADQQLRPLNVVHFDCKPPEIIPRSPAPASPSVHGASTPTPTPALFKSPPNKRSAGNESAKPVSGSPSNSAFDILLELEDFREIDLHTAASIGDMESVCSIIKTGRIGVDTMNNSGWLPLHYAACLGHERICRYLIDSGAQIDAGNIEGRTALMLAASRGNSRVVQLLVTEGPYRCNVDAVDYNGYTALMHAGSAAHDDIVQTLVYAHADVHVLDSKQGLNVFMLACAHGHSTIVTFLMQHGNVHYQQTSKKGETAERLAIINKREDVVRCFARARTQPATAHTTNRAIDDGPAQMRRLMANAARTAHNQSPTPSGTRPILTNQQMAATFKAPPSVNRAGTTTVKVEMPSSPSVHPNKANNVNYEAGRGKQEPGVPAVEQPVKTEKLERPASVASVSETGSDAIGANPNAKKLATNCVNLSRLFTEAKIKDPAQCVEKLREHKVTYEQFLRMDMDALKNIGIGLLGPRKKIKKIIDDLRAELEGVAVADRPFALVGAAGNGVLGKTTLTEQDILIQQLRQEKVILEQKLYGTRKSLIERTKALNTCGQHARSARELAYELMHKYTKDQEDGKPADAALVRNVLSQLINHAQAQMLVSLDAEAETQQNDKLIQTKQRLGAATNGNGTNLPHSEL